MLSYSLFVALGLFAVNVLTPGASFVLTVSQSMTHGRRFGLFIAFGLTTADTLFAIVASAGLSALISQNPLVIKGFSLLGGVWFAYGGVCLLLRQKKPPSLQKAASTAGNLPVFLAYRQGFSAGAFNPQAILFFATLFLAAVSSKPSLQEVIVLVAGVAVVSALIRSNIVVLFTTGAVMDFYRAQRRKMETVSGSMLALFGLKLAVPAALVITHAVLK